LLPRASLLDFLDYLGGVFFVPVPNPQHNDAAATVVVLIPVSIVILVVFRTVAFNGYS